jgi:hypothetical protein
MNTRSAIECVYNYKQYALSILQHITKRLYLSKYKIEHMAKTLILSVNLMIIYKNIL